MLNFIPAIWAARLLVALEKALVFGQLGIINRDYEGEIQAYGDSVKIGSIGDPTVGTYTKNTDIADPEVISDADQTLVIDRSKYFNIYIDSIDKAQQNVNSMDEAMRRAGYKLKDEADQFVAASYVNVPSGNLVGSDGSPIAVGAANAAYNLLVDLGVKLDEADVPTDGRFVVIPPFFHGFLLKDDRFVKSGTQGGEQRLVNGQVGEAAGFQVLKSNNCPIASSTKYKVIAGHSMAYTFADQIVEVETYKPEKRFGSAVKGLHVYGGRLIRPSAWAVGTVTNASS